MSLRILVIYYSQTGQLKEILVSLLQPIASSPGSHIIYKEIIPIPPYPFPWSSDAFFQAMPESVMGIPCEIAPLNIDSTNYDLVILGYQPWYLSPSIPIHAFLQSAEAKTSLQNKPVITVTGCRNMWAMAYDNIQTYLRKAGAKHIGHIALSDKHNNLVSVFTIIRWLIKGIKTGTTLLPPAGVSKQDIENTVKFGEIILREFQTNEGVDLQPNLFKAGAVEINPVLIKVEKTAKKIFEKWAPFILKKGKAGDIKRLGRVRLFKYYLITVIYLVSPIASLFIRILHLFNPSSKHRIIQTYRATR